MSKHKLSANYQQGIQNEQQSRSLLIAGYLQKFSLPSLFNRELTEGDYHMWDKLLCNYPLKAIDYAFENWERNGKVFPKPANILELIGVWTLSNKTKFKTCGNCEDGWIRVFHGKTDAGHEIDPKIGAVMRCQCNQSGEQFIDHYGQGYNEEDMRWLYKRYQAKRGHLPKKPMTDAEIDQLLDELDVKRGRSPQWRKAG
jgi:hypothetical protein